MSGISNGALSNQSGASITETLINTTNTAKIVRYVIVPSAYGCTGPAFNYDVTVNPTPVINSAANNPAICSSTPQAYTITSNVSGATFTWSRVLVSGISNAAVTSQAGNSITETLINTTNTAKTVRYVIVPSANGCAGPAFNYDVTVNPTPVVNSPATGTICNSTAQAYTITSNVSGATFSWSRASATGISNTAISNQNGSNITETLINTSNSIKVVRYVIVPIANGCSGPAFNYDVTVNPTPVVNSVATAVVCNSIAQNYLITSNVSGSSFIWSRAAVAGISNFTVNNQNGSSIIETLVNTSNAPVVVRYVITPTANGCSGPAFNYDVTINPTPVVTSAAAGTICNNTTQNYAITSNVSGATFTWSRAAVSGISNVAVSNQTGGSITEKLVNTTSAPILVRYSITPSANGCSGPTFQYSITVEPSPTVTNASLLQTICSLASSVPVNLTSNVAGTVFTWTAVATSGISGFTASGTGAIPAQTLVNSGTVQGRVTYTIVPSVNGCPGLPSTYIINVTPKPATPSVASNSPVCETSALNLTTPAVAGATYLWSGPNGFTSVLQNPVVSSSPLAAAGVYSVMVTVNGCTSDAGSTTVAVIPTPAAPITVNNSPICAGNTLTLSTNTVTGGTYSWTGPNGFTSSLQNPQILAASAAASGVYSLRVTVNGCTSIAGTTNVLVNPIPPAPTAGSNGPVCAGNTINLFANSLNGATYSWTGPNGFTSTQRNPVISGSTLANSGTYFVTASVGGCAGPAQAVVVAVNSTPVNPVVSSNSPVCTTYPIQLTATSFAGAVYSWTGPNGFTSNLQNPVISSAALANAGTYTVTINAPGCTLVSTRSTVVRVNQTPISPTSANNGPVCVGKNVNLTASTIAGATYSWTGPNGFTSTLQNPVKQRNRRQCGRLQRNCYR